MRHQKYLGDVDEKDVMEYPHTFEFEREGHIMPLMVGFLNVKYMRDRPIDFWLSESVATGEIFHQFDEQQWAAIRDRHVQRMKKFKSLIILSWVDYEALLHAVECNPIGKRLMGKSWEKLRDKAMEAGLSTDDADP